MLVYNNFYSNNFLLQRHLLHVVALGLNYKMVWVRTSKVPNVWESESYSENSDDSKTVKNEAAQNNLKR